MITKAEELFNLCKEGKGSQYAVFLDTPLKKVKKMTEEDCLPFNMHYDIPTETLVLKARGLAAWQVPISGLASAISRKSFDMGLDLNMMGAGRTTQFFSKTIKEPDYSWIVEPAPGAYRVSVTAETGQPQSWERLNVCAQRWIEDERSEVQIAIVFTTDIIEKVVEVVVWENMMPFGSRPAVKKTQHICIWRGEDGRGVASDEMVLPFRKVMGRDPNPHRPLEKDFVFSIDDLRGFNISIFGY